VKHNNYITATIDASVIYKENSIRRALVKCQQSLIKATGVDLGGSPGTCPQ